MLEGNLNPARNAEIGKSWPLLSRAPCLGTIGALIVRIGFLSRVPFRVTLRDQKGYYSVGSVIIRIGLWGPIIL